MKSDDLRLGVRVKSNREFSGVVKGTQGTVIERYGAGDEEGVMIRWDQPIAGMTCFKPLTDGFNLKKESQFLDPVAELKEESQEDIGNDTVRCSSCGAKGPKQDGNWSFRPAEDSHPFFSAWWHHCPESPCPQMNPWQGVREENWEFYSYEYEKIYHEPVGAQYKKPDEGSEE